MKTIYKFTLDKLLETIELPRGAEVLDVQVQGTKPVMWVLGEFDENAPPEAYVKRKFVMFMTGEEIPDKVIGELKYIGTFQSFEYGGAHPLVFHLFEETT